MHRFQCPPPTKADPTDPVTGPVSVPTAEQIKVDAPSDKTGGKSRGPKTHHQGDVCWLGFLGPYPPIPPWETCVIS